MQWAQVPFFIARRLPVAVQLVAKIAPHLNEKTAAYWCPDDGRIRLVGDRNDCRQAAPHLRSYLWEIGDHGHPEEFVRIKAAAPLGPVGSAWTTANSLVGGPNPLTNSIVGGLVGGGIGYAGGALLEHVFPERYLERGKLRRTLAMLGGATGAAPGIWKGNVNSRNDGTSFLQGMTTSDTAPPANPALQKLGTQLLDMPLNEQLAAAIDAEFPLIKESDGGALDVPSVPVDAFNRAVWNDVRMGTAASENPFGTKSPFGDNEQALRTPPELAAATSGLMAGIASQTGAEILRPRDVIAGLASAGVGLGVANMAGRTLSALAGLSGPAQEQLQQLGVWGGVLRHVVPPIFGYR